MILSARFSAAFGHLTWQTSLKFEEVSLSFLSDSHSGAVLWHLVAFSNSQTVNCDAAIPGLLAHMYLLALTGRPLVALLEMELHTIRCRWWNMTQ